MKICLLILLAVVAFALPIPAQLVAVRPYGENAEGIPADQPKVVRTIAAAYEAETGERVMTAEELAEIVAKNRDAVRAVVLKRPAPPEPEPDDSELGEVATELGIPGATAAAVWLALARKQKAQDAKIAALEATKEGSE